MGALIAETILPWELVKLDCQHRSERVVQDDDPTQMKFYRGVEYTLVLRRRCLKVTGFTESCGDTQTIFQFTTGADVAMTWGSTGRRFVCRGDVLSPVEGMVNEMVQEQVWYTVGDWEEISAGEFLAES